MVVPAAVVVALDDGLLPALVRRELVPGDVEVAPTLLAVVVAGTVADCAAVWLDVVAACADAESLFVWLDPPHADSPIAADTAIASSDRLPANLAPRGAYLVLSSEASIATKRMPRRLDHQGNSSGGQPFQTYPLLSTSADRVYEMNTTRSSRSHVTVPVISGISSASRDSAAWASGCDPT